LAGDNCIFNLEDHQWATAQTENYLDATCSKPPAWQASD
jgi:hypothetical protein